MTCQCELKDGKVSEMCGAHHDAFRRHIGASFNFNRFFVVEIEGRELEDIVIGALKGASEGTVRIKSVRRVL